MSETIKTLYPLVPGLCRMQGVAIEGKAAVTAAFSGVLAAAMLYPAQGEIPYEQNHETDMILRGVHPDVQVVTGEKAGTISVDAVRAMQREAYIKPNQAPGRVFILPGAAAMTVQAQNALLKIIETPPAGVRFIFTMENRHNLLPTVQSRLVIVAVEAEFAPLPADFPEAAREVAGILGDWRQVTDLVGEKAAIQLFTDCAEALQAIQGGNTYRLMALFTAHEKKREDFIQFCLVMRTVCAHHLRQAGGQAPRLYRAAAVLGETVEKAGHNVFLPMLGSYAAGQIMAPV